ncbi:MAG: hypothetical protein ACAH05_05000 [Methylophilus sp.]
MTELLITPDKGALKPQPVLLLTVLLFFTIANYLGKGFNATTQAMLFLTVLLTAYAFWRLYIDSKKQILINRNSRQIQVITYTFFGTRQDISYPIMYFGSIRSYISVGNRARNVVELVTNDGNRSLPLSSFLPNGGKKFWSVEVETENPEAANLVTTVASFIPVQNLGFVEHHFAKFPLEKEEGNLIKNIFK